MIFLHTSASFWTIGPLHGHCPLLSLYSSGFQGNFSVSLSFPPLFMIIYFLLGGLETKGGDIWYF